METIHTTEPTYLDKLMEATFEGIEMDSPKGKEIWANWKKCSESMPIKWKSGDYQRTENGFVISWDCQKHFEKVFRETCRLSGIEVKEPLPNH